MRGARPLKVDDCARNSAPEYAEEARTSSTQKGVQDAQTCSFPRWLAKSVRDGVSQGCDDHSTEQWFVLTRAGTYASWIERGEERKDRFAAILTLIRSILHEAA